MDLFNRPPTIAEDTVVYTIYPNHESDISLTALSTLILTYVNDVLLPSNHIWHRDSFELHVAENASQQSGGTHLEGTIRVGDCVDDEWCTVWLLTQVSQKWDVVISVYDTDGEFLLIEAAEHLPKWVAPENAENRVWIYQSSLHLIPLEHVSPPTAKSYSVKRKLPRHGDSDTEDVTEPNSYITIEHALRLVRNTNVRTKADEAVQAAIQRKIKGYPAVFPQHMHKTRAFLPADIVFALSRNPSLVQKSIEAFYTRDALQLRAVAKMARFPPSTSVYTNVTMTRTAYAQLMGQKFHLPKVFGKWSEAEGSKEWRWKDVGMKVACGFEMLYAENRSKPLANQGGSESTEALKDALRRDPAYKSYLDSLKRAEYFPSTEVEGSAKWNDLESKAAKKWVEVRKKENANRPSFTAMVDEAISLATPYKDSVLSSSTVDVEEDSDQWMTVTPEELERTLESGRQASSAMDLDTPNNAKLGNEDAEAQRQAEKLGSLAEKVNKFVRGKGDIEGALFEEISGMDSPRAYLFESDAPSDEGEDDDDLELSDPATSDADSEVDPTKDRQEALDRLVAPLDPADYGKIPSLEQVTDPPSVSRKTLPVTLDSETRTLPNGETRRIRKPILMRDKFDGVDSDDETDSGEEETGDDVKHALDALREAEGGSDDEAPQVVGGVSHDIDINMEDEQEEFLKFSREALGITDTMWTQIVDDRKGRGAFVPESSKATPELSKATEGKLKDKSVKFFDAISDPSPAPASKQPAESVQPRIRNPNLDSFEAVMEAMEAELEKTRRTRQETKQSGQSDPVKTKPLTSVSSPNGKGKGKETIKEEDEEDLDAAMDAELRAALQRSDDEDDEDTNIRERDVEEAGMDYNLIKNFLESFQSQAGLSGPVSNLAGRLQPEWKLPRDEKE
ncbi:hypothetical protein FRB99_006220 [Tulasnella sp. 403]|nr:hypothetical protein FRB99_006220 [Tulasnella sp. 403]